MDRSKGKDSFQYRRCPGAHRRGDAPIPQGSDVRAGRTRVRLPVSAARSLRHLHPHPRRRASSPAPPLRGGADTGGHRALTLDQIDTHHGQSPSTSASPTRFTRSRSPVRGVRRRSPLRRRGHAVLRGRGAEVRAPRARRRLRRGGHQRRYPRPPRHQPLGLRRKPRRRSRRCSRWGRSCPSATGSRSTSCSCPSASTSARVRPKCSTCPVLEMCQQVGVTSHR